MATRARTPRRPRRASRASMGGVAVPSAGDATPATTRYICVFREGADAAALSALGKQAGLKRVCAAADFESGAIDIAQADAADVTYFEEIGAAVISAPDGAAAVSALGAEAAGPILAMEPEQVMYAIAALPPDEGEGSASYLRGYRDAVDHLSGRLLGGAAAEALPGAVEPMAAFADDAQSTWGLQATRVLASRWTGRGIRVAVLDTGLDLGHPDFAGRRITHRSFIANEPTQDRHGHGTHCTGAALGPRSVHNGVRAHGCASSGEIYIGKVLSNGGSGADQGILAGINWAVAAKCHVISMSLGASVAPGEPPSRVYETVAQRALAAGTLIVAAAGNESQRPGRVAPVGRPANCRSILAVAAVDSRLGIARFSCGGINPNGGGVDIAGPGVDVFSSVPRPRMHTRMDGTSMATPHVAGIAALYAESDKSLRARALWQALVSNARRLPLPVRDVGSGLVLAP